MIIIGQCQRGILLECKLKILDNYFIDNTSNMKPDPHKNN